MSAQSVARALAVLFAISAVSVSSAATIVVTNTSDLVNGDTRSIAALIASPGPDGISLREAVEAANSDSGVVRITFDALLAGKTISIATPLELRRSHITIEGPASASPLMTIEGSAIPTILQRSEPAMIYVLASDIRIAHLRLIAILNVGIGVFTGSQVPPAGPLAIQDVVIDGNEFDNRGFTTPNPFPSAISVGNRGYNGEDGTSLRAISIVNNHIIGLQSTGISGSPNGRNNLLEDFIVDGNTVEQTPFPMEVSIYIGDHNTIRRSRITNNRFIDPVVTLIVGNIANDGSQLAEVANVVDDTVISDNLVISDGGEIDVAAGLVPPGAAAGARDSIVRNTVISNNVIATGRGFVIIGGGAGSQNNLVDGISITNNTIVTTAQAGVRVVMNENGGSGNVVKNVTIQNSIFVGPVNSQNGGQDEIFGDITPDQVRFSITHVPRSIGVNGNFSADPQFVDVARRDYHLLPTSPAIRRADALAAPPADRDCRPRKVVPDIGAYESGTAAMNRVTLVVQGNGTATVPGGLPCGSSLGFPPLTTINLVATPSPGAVFSGWDGDEDCKDGVVTLTGDRICIATFAAVRRRSVKHGTRNAAILWWS